MMLSPARLVGESIFPGGLFHARGAAHDQAFQEADWNRRAYASPAGVGDQEPQSNRGIPAIARDSSADSAHLDAIQRDSRQTTSCTRWPALATGSERRECADGLSIPRTLDMDGNGLPGHRPQRRLQEIRQLPASDFCQSDSIPVARGTWCGSLWRLVTQPSRVAVHARCR